MESRKLTKADIDKVRDIEGFPIADDEDIIALSDAPYYTACPNPFVEEFIAENGTLYDEATDDYHREPFAADVSEGKGNTEWKQWAEAEKDDIALIMSWYRIDWKKKDTHNKHLSVLDYKKQERAKEVAALEEELEGAQVVLELKEERIESLEKEIESKRDCFRKEQYEAQKKLDDTIAENQKLQSETTDLRLKNSELQMEYYENVDKLTDKKKEIEAAQKEADKWMMISDTAKWQIERAQFEMEEAERLKKELLGAVDGDDYLKEQVIELRYQNQILREENRSLKDKLEKAYEFMKQFVIGGINLLEKFMEWIGEKVKDVERGR